MLFCQLNEEDQNKIINDMIENEHIDCFDCCNNIGQMFDNIKHTKTMREAMRDMLSYEEIEHQHQLLIKHGF